MKKRCMVAAAALMLISFVVLNAQNQHPNNARGFTPTGAYSSFDIDHINLFNGNLVITIPLGQQYPVNGNLSYRFNLFYNSFIWSRESTCEGNNDPAPITQFYNGLTSLSRYRLCSQAAPSEYPAGPIVVMICNDNYEQHSQPPLINPYILLQEGKQPNIADRCQSFTTINPASNAGSGWQLHFGKIFRPRNDVREITTIATEKLSEVYQSPDGSEHQFFHKLHEDDPAESTNIYYTRDSSYLRMWRNPTPSNESYGTSEYSYTIEFPNGEKHYFQRLRIQNGTVLANGSPLTLPQYEDKLVKMEDRFGNYVKFDYFDDPSDTDNLKDNRWEITDSVNRKHVVHFQKVVFDVGGMTLIDRVELETVNDTMETYDLGYDNQRIDVSKPHVRQSFMEFPPYTFTNDETATIEAGFLTSVTLPDGSQYTMPVADSYLPTIMTAGALAPGALVKMNLPTGGRIEWDYKSIDDGSGLGYIFSPGISGLQHARVAPGVRVRRLYEIGNKLVGTWNYDPKLGSMPDGCTIAISAEPCGAYHIVNKVTQPTGDFTEYFFSVYPHNGPSQYQDRNRRDLTQPHRADYGLPFSKDPRNAGQLAPIAADNSGKPLFISSITYNSAGTMLRKNYVRYEGDKYSASDGFFEPIEYNPRLAASRTVFKDDSDSYTEIQFSSFDGLGHYRNTQTFGLGSDTRFEVTQYNMDQGTYQIDSTTNSAVAGTSYTAFPETRPWVLGNYEKVIASESGKRSTTWFNFNHQGQLLDKRIRKDFEPASSNYLLGANDVLVHYNYFANGNLQNENYYGGGKQGGLNTSEPFPAMADSASEFKITYQYQCLRDNVAAGTTSVLSSKRYRPKAGEVDFKTIDDNIDCSSGLPILSRDSAGVATTYTYGVMGRLAYIKNSQSVYEQIIHEPHTPGGTNLPRVTVKRRANGDESSNTLLSESIYIYDSLGRLDTEKQSRPGNTYKTRYTKYNANGWVTKTSEWLENNGIADNKWTTNELYDPFGRPGRIVSADGKVTTFGYNGIREVNRTVSVATQISSTRVVTEQSATSKEIYDRQGRLIRLIEPSGSTGQNTTWIYWYNVNNQIAGVTVSDPSPNGKGQNRAFGYDNLGNLLTESHPERAWAQYSDYDTLGNMGTSYDGVHWLNYSYDGHGRLKEVRELDESVWQWRPLKSLSYDSGAGFGTGKLASATRYNYVSNPYELQNVALGKVATQSSTVAGGTAARAVDGRRDGNFFNNSVTHTDFTAQPWWEVDLGSVSTIDFIKIWNRSDCCGDRLGNFDVQVSDQPFANQSEITSYYSAGQGGRPTRISVGRSGRYVRVKLRGTNYLSLAEVEVFARPSVLTAVPITEEYSYNGLDGRLSRKVTRLSSASANPNVFDQTFTYDQLGNLSQQTYPECTSSPCNSSTNAGGSQARPLSVNYNFDKGWLTSVGSTGSVTNTYARSILYNPNGTIQSVEHGNNVKDTITLDPNYMQRPANIEVKKIGTASPYWNSGAYSYDGAGNISKIGNDWYLYDKVNRLVEGSAMSLAMKKRYNYDAFGNLMSVNTYDGVVNPTASNAPTTLTLNANSEKNQLALHYDAAGNVLGLLPSLPANPRPTLFYQYDALNMMKNAPGMTYLYGPTDERVWMVEATDNDTVAPAPTPTPTPVPPPPPPSDIVWFDDALPAGAQPSAGWNWLTTTNPSPYTGTRAHQPTAAGGVNQQFFVNATNTVRINADDKLFAYVYLNPANMPRQLMLQWNDGTWEHRAYWGENLINFGTDSTPSRQYMGPLPAAGQWVRLEVPAWRVGLEGRTINGMALSLYDGGVTWDRAGKAPATPVETVWFDDGLPTGAQPSSGWNWSASTDPAPFSGTRVHRPQAAAAGSQQFFTNATSTLAVNPGDTLFAYVYLDPVNMPSEVMLQWYDSSGSWEHRAYWGQNLINLGTDGTSTRRHMGELPRGGQWVKLEVPAWKVGIEGQTITGLAFATYNGQVTWDRAGKAAAQAPPATDIVWVGDNTPAGAVLSGENEVWSWVSSNPPPISGSRSHQSATFSGAHQHLFTGATQTLAVVNGDTLVSYVYLDPVNPPRMVMLQWNDGTWEHRAYWGENLWTWGTNGTNSRRHMGRLPELGRWVRLEVPANLVGLEGRTVHGIAFTLFGGKATWDHAAKFSGPAQTTTTPPASPSSTISVVETVTLRGLNNEVLREYQVTAGTWKWMKDYLYAGMKLLASEAPVVGRRHYHLDHLGTTRVMTDSAGNMLAGGPYQYFPFGEDAIAPLNPDERLRFTGHERDRDQIGETLDYMHARFYRAGSAKFMSVDPGRDWDPKRPQSWNLYSYVRNNPLSGIDRNGRKESKRVPYNDLPASVRARVEDPKFREAVQKISKQGLMRMDGTEVSFLVYVKDDGGKESVSIQINPITNERKEQKIEVRGALGRVDDVVHTHPPGSGPNPSTPDTGKDPTTCDTCTAEKIKGKVWVSTHKGLRVYDSVTNESYVVLEGEEWKQYLNPKKESPVNPPAPAEPPKQQ